jgi:prepilin-type N-terminal cleavage/methylation domain-containing protein
MKPLTSPKRSNRRPPVPAPSNRAFTLVELLVVLAVLALLASTMLPALAGSKRKCNLAQCRENLRQIYVGSLVYARDFDGWFPVWGGYDAAHPVNKINGLHYTRYLYTSWAPDGTVMPKEYALGTDAYGGWDQNLGYLYGGGIIPGGRAFFCPGFADASTNSLLYQLSWKFYSTPEFMSVHGNGAIRSSYMYNPRLATPATGSLRAYQKVTDLHSRDVFAIDYLANGNMDGASSIGVPFTPDYWAHWPGQGLQAAFTDGSARFCTISDPALFNNIVTKLDSSSTFWAAQYNALFNALRDAP